MILNNILDVIMFVDDTGILITANSQDELIQRFNNVLNHMSRQTGSPEIQTELKF